MTSDVVSSSLALESVELQPMVSTSVAIHDLPESPPQSPPQGGNETTPIISLSLTSSSSSTGTSPATPTGAAVITTVSSSSTSTVSGRLSGAAAIAAAVLPNSSLTTYQPLTDTAPLTPEPPYVNVIAPPVDQPPLSPD
jgi:hypothetical protein